MVKNALARDMDEKKWEEMGGAGDETENKNTQTHTLATRLVYYCVIELPH